LKPEGTNPDFQLLQREINRGLAPLRIPNEQLPMKISHLGVKDCVTMVRLFDASLTRANANPKKIYCIDHALITSIASGILLNSGHLLENLVFLALRRMSSDIFYYRQIR